MIVAEAHAEARSITRRAASEPSGSRPRLRRIKSLLRSALDASTRRRSTSASPSASRPARFAA